MDADEPTDEPKVRIKSARRKSSIKVSPERRRSSMGEYLPPPGGRPLSAQCYPTPGPGEYNLQGVRSVGQDAPRPSLHTQLHPLKSHPQPSPSDYDTSEGAVWGRRRSISLKAKQITWPYDTRKNAHLTEGDGPGLYNTRTKPVGPKRSLSARHREGLHAGHPNYLVQPVDTLGFGTPGPPRTRPESVRGPKPSLGMKLSGKGDESLGPGPASYDLSRPVPPTPLIGERLTPLQEPDYPAPNTYILPTSTAEGKTFGMRSGLSARERGPPPNIYHLRQPRVKSAHFTLRAFPTKMEPRPSPAEYTPSEADHESAPEYTCRDKCLPVFPDILLYPEHDVQQTPGAGEYNPDRDFADNSNPAYSHGLPLPLKPNKNPGPNKYKVDHSQLSTLATPPSYTMRPRVGCVSKEPSPGPAEYAPQTKPAHSFSITPRRPSQKAQEGPAPNSYQVSTGITRKGAGGRGKSASMKGRPSTMQYNGFSNAALVRLQTMS